MFPPMRRLTFAVLFAASSLHAGAQDTTRFATLTLDEALSLAKRYNPLYLEQINDRKSTALGVRTARAQLFPRVTSSMGLNWREGRPTFFEGQQFGSAADALGSSYSIGIGVTYSLQSFLAPSQAIARVDAADAGVIAQEQTLRQQVTNQYFTAVQSVRNADLQDSLVKSQELQFQLAKARETIGSGIALDTRNAEGALLRQQLAAERAHNTADLDKLRLFETIGIPATGDVQLTTDLPIVEPTFQLPELLADAKVRNASLASTRANMRVAELTRRSARGSYIPSLGFSTGLGGQTSMNTDAVGSERTWPFGFSRNPLSFSAGFNLTLWDGFQREQNVEAATIAVTNAQHELRRTDLNVTTSVTTLHSELRYAWRAYQLQLQIVETARQALQLAQERYKVGSTAFTDLSLAQDRYQQEENTRLVFIYNYHRTFAQLEAAVGRPLR
jgi:outer membrane protein